MAKETQSCRGAGSRRGWVRGLIGAAVVVAIVGCEVDSFFDPTVLGRWERTPVVLPILEQIDVIDEGPAKVEGYSTVMPEDLIPEAAEYVIGVGDYMTVSVFELLQPGAESTQTRRVDELGKIRLPVIGTMDVVGFTPSSLEREIADVLARRGLIRDAIVSVQVQEGRQRTYSVIGEATGATGTSVGTYQIPQNDFRILEAVAQARGVAGQTKRLYVIRQVQLTPPATTAPGETVPEATPTTDPAQLIEELLRGVEMDRPTDREPGAEPPQGLGEGLEEQPAPQWMHVDGKWVRVDQGPQATTPEGDGEGTALETPGVVQRVIEVPWARLLEGDLRYNLVIRPGDIIRVPAPVSGNVFLGGQIGRPGTYALPGDRELTLKQLIFSSGGLQSLAIPERVDLIRRIGDNNEATVRLNLRDIFNGVQPDFFLKPNDSINVGTSLPAYPLLIVRNGFRYSFGFGFVLDRNFSSDVFGSEGGQEQGF